MSEAVKADEADRRAEEITNGLQDNLRLIGKEMSAVGADNLRITIAAAIREAVTADRERRSDDEASRVERAAVVIDSVIAFERERCAVVAEEYGAEKWAAYKQGSGSGPDRANPRAEGAADGADEIARRIRANEPAPGSSGGGASGDSAAG
jgi:hypothetical protein